MRYLLESHLHLGTVDRGTLLLVCMVVAEGVETDIVCVSRSRREVTRDFVSNGTVVVGHGFRRGNLWDLPTLDKHAVALMS